MKIIIGSNNLMEFSAVVVYCLFVGTKIKLLLREELFKTGFYGGFVFVALIFFLFLIFLTKININLG
ncbi:unnamed protein product [Meloidogyne enterolobii]|uniref:Uncharacterized protein n=1 Tax=Meloidogyne enterolobii TaxID=390850 RepID=A0ACB1AK28_MELEN